MREITKDELEKRRRKLGEASSDGGTTEDKQFITYLIFYICNFYLLLVKLIS